jgi:hypothetical protein
MKRKRKSNRRFLVFIGFFVVVGGLFLYQNYTSADIIIPQSLTSTNSNLNWWDNDYSFRKPIKPSGSNEKFSIKINHAEMIVDGKSNADGSDLKIIASGAEGFSVVPFGSSGLNSINTQISFSSQGKNYDEYFLYYGNPLPDNPSKVLGLNNAENFTDTQLGDEESPAIRISSNKKWVLKENSTKNVSLKLFSNKSFEESDRFYVVLNNNTNDRKLVKYQDGNIEVDVMDLKIGKNSVYLAIQSTDGIYRTNTTSFYYTAPVYVSWTMDWEGTAPEQRYLDSIAAVSEKHNVEITHYFNPRLYILLKATEQRKKEITQWVVERLKNNGDDIGLHLHMHHDMVEEAGVKSKYNIEGWDKSISGYDIPTTEYSYDEVLKIIGWGKEKLPEQIKKYTGYEIPELQGYRAGGWFADLTTLKAIKAAGFLYDTSGRSSFAIGSNKVTQKWDLKNTSQPYKPSVSNQSRSSSQNLGLIEVPNNGSDSYWSGAKELITNFYANYTPGQFLDSDKILVYLSHPDWFYIDEPKLNELFTELKKYRNDLDLGPVKYTTMREYLSESNHIKELNGPKD